MYKDRLIKQIKKNVLFNLFLCFLFLITLYLFIALPSISQAEYRPHFIAVASAQSPPFSYLAKNKKPQGILIDFWNLWARKNGADITFVLDSFDNTIEIVRNGKADFHAGIFSSSQRTGYMDFSAGFLDDTLSLFVQDKLNIQAEYSIHCRSIQHSHQCGHQPGILCRRIYERASSPGKYKTICE